MVKIELSDSHRATVGGQRVRRALPMRARRTVGAWCFADHIGPDRIESGGGLGIGPHPHIGLQTVTWLVAGELLHRDSLGSVQVIRPGQLNLMTAGRGISHAEEATGHRGEMHGMQLWVAQPDSTRNAAPAFEHHSELPRAELPNGSATVLIGSFGGVGSAARRDTEHFGVEMVLGRGTCVVPVRPDDEHAIIVMAGEVSVGETAVVPGKLAYLGPGPDEIPLVATGSVRLMLLGGVPFETRPLIWWNFVARDNGEVDRAADAWNDGDERFGDPGSELARVAAPRRPWSPA